MPIALLSNWKLLFGGGFILVALLAIGVQTMRLSYAQASLARAEGVVAQFRGTVEQFKAAAEIQNAAVAVFRARSDEAAKAAQEALRKTRAAHAGDDARIAALVARMPAATPDAACRAADAAILEFAK